jgi:hypothetical protein
VPWFSGGLFPSGFPAKIRTLFCPLSCITHALPTSSSCLYLQNEFCGEVQFTKLLIVQLSPFSHYFIRQNPVLKHPHSMLLYILTLWHTQRYIQEGSHLHTHCRGNLKCQDLESTTGITQRWSNEITNGPFSAWNWKSSLTTTVIFARKHIGHANIFRAVYWEDFTFLHLVDSECYEEVTCGSRRLYKLKPILDHLSDRFRNVYIPECEMSVDELPIMWKVLLSWKIYIPAKWAEFGMKSFELWS